MKSSSEWRMRTAGGVPYTVISRGGGFGREEATASETYIIPANRLLSFALESIPRPYVLIGNLIYPRFRPMPGLPTMSTKSIKWEPFDSGLPVDPFGSDTTAPSGTYQEFVKVTIEYATTPNNDGDESDPDDPMTILEVSANASGTFLAVPTRGNATWYPGDLSSEEYAMADGDFGVKEADIPQTVRQPEVEWSVRWPQIPYEYWTDKLVTRLRSKLGKVNEEEMTLFHNAPPETIMFLSWSMKRSYTWREGEAGKSPVEVDMRFLEKNFEGKDEVQVTHNHVYRPGWGWRRLEINGEDMYAKTNLDQIFKEDEPEPDD